jgi:hypothetical protein
MTIKDVEGEDDHDYESPNSCSIQNSQVSRSYSGLTTCTRTMSWPVLLYSALL